MAIQVHVDDPLVGIVPFQDFSLTSQRSGFSHTCFVADDDDFVCN